MVEQSDVSDVDVLVLAAGFGTRLRPLTSSVPKPLVSVRGISLLEWNLILLRNAGFRRIYINTHYLSSQFSSFVQSRDWSPLELCLIHEPVILDTGGAIRNLEPRLSSDVLVTMNGDSLFGDDFDPSELVRAQRSHPAALATFAFRKHSRAASYGEFGVSREGEVTSFLGRQRGPVDESGLMFIGVQALSVSAIQLMPPTGYPFSTFRDFYAHRFQDGDTFRAVPYGGYWSDVGTHSDLLQAEAEFSGNRRW